MPLKRHEALVQLSREHHFALLLCRKIKKGINKNIDISRIFRYADWFYSNHLKQHFAIEEKTVFPILGTSNNMIFEAISQHRHLEYLFEKSERNTETIISISKYLDKHVRFEERQVFEEIQKIATIEQLAEISGNKTPQYFSENNEDRFWE